MVKVNGEQKELAGKTIREYLIEADYPLSRIAVELNGEILPKSDYDRVLGDGDTVEVVSFVGGG